MSQIGAVDQENLNIPAEWAGSRVNRGHISQKPFSLLEIRNVKLVQYASMKNKKYVYYVSDLSCEIVP